MSYVLTGTLEKGFKLEAVRVPGAHQAQVTWHAPQGDVSLKCLECPYQIRGTEAFVVEKWNGHWKH